MATRWCSTAANTGLWDKPAENVGPNRQRFRAHSGIGEHRASSTCCEIEGNPRSGAKSPNDVRTLAGISCHNLPKCRDRKSTRLNSQPPCNLVCRLLLEKKPEDGAAEGPTHRAEERGRRGVPPHVPRVDGVLFF